MSIFAILGVISALVLVRSAFPSSEQTDSCCHGDKVYRLIPTTEEHLNILKTLQGWFGDGVTFLSSVGALNAEVDVMVTLATETEILAVLQESGISYEILTDNEDRQIENSIHGQPVQLSGDEVPPLNWTAYHRLDTIYHWLDDLTQTYPDWVQVLAIGRSYEGRPIRGIKITFDESNPGIFVEGGSHAREWISPAFVTYLINEILSPTNEEFQEVARAHTWFIFPNVNPDGYEYSQTVDRVWRKTRQPHGNYCIGADPNRNWDFKWLANGGASEDPCDLVYAGPKPFSEVEVKALADFIATVNDQFYIYLTIHSFAQQILLPYGYTSEHLDNYNESMAVATAAAEALAKRYGTQYAVGTSYETEYVNSGSSTDFVKAVYGTRFVYTYELRDTVDGPYFFYLPPEEIIPVCLETIDSLDVLIREAQKLAYPDSRNVQV